MNTIIDTDILEDFFSSIPQPIPFGDIKEINCWNSFWTFLQSETNVYINNHNKIEDFNNPYLKFYDQLSEGRGDTKFAPIKFDKPIDEELPINNPHTFYCFNEEDENEQKKYRRRNGFVIGFKNDYKDIWKDLKLLNKPHKLPVRKNYNGKILESWDKLGEYLLPFTDVVLTDSYIIQDAVKVESNLKPILLQLDKATPVKYNLMVITYEGKDNPNSIPPESKLNGKNEYEKLSKFIEDNHLKCELSLVISTSSRYIKKEHDRGIFMNYLWIDSGDSFNYYDSQNNIITNGTKIYFNSLASPENFNTAKAALENLSAIVIKMKEKFPQNYVFGPLKNRLLTKIIKKNLKQHSK